jgi:tight adherence protein C
VLVPLAAFGLIAAVAWMLMDWFTTKNNRVEERLEDFGKRRGKKDDKDRYAQQNKMTAMLEKATMAMSKPLTPKTEKETNKVKDKLSYAGFRSETAPQIFWGLKFICLVIGLMMAGGTALTLDKLGMWGLLKLFGPVAFMFFLPDLVVGFLGSRRKQAIFLALPDALDLMVVCVEAGLGLDHAMRKVTEEMKKASPVIAEEFGLCNLHMQMGRPRGQVLQDLGQRSGVDDLRALASILIQADKFGSSIAQALRVQSESMRTRRRQLAEEKAAKTAVKLIFPLVLFIFPGIFVVILVDDSMYMM